MFVIVIIVIIVIIAAPARKVEIFHQKISYDAVNVTCVAEGVYPRPRLQLYRKDRSG